MKMLKEIWENRRYRYAAVGVLVAVLVGVGIWLNQSYGVAVVNGTSIPIRQFNKNYHAAAIYYENIKKSYEENNQTPPELTEKDIKAQILTNLIQAVLIDEAAKREVGTDLPRLIDERVASYQDDKDLEAASKGLYGLGGNDLVSEVLIPQAEQDILTGRLFLKNQNFDDWLREAAKNATVHIFSKDFSWDGEKVMPVIQ